MAAKNIYRISYILLGIFGILIQLGIFSNSFYPWAFNYYTVLSNILCVIYFGIRLMYDNTQIPKNPFKRFITSPLTKYSVTMCITLTFLVYHFLLNPVWNNYSGEITIFTIGNYIVHYIIPVLTIIDFLIFDRTKEYLPWYSPFVWMIVPIVYFIFIIIRAPLLGNIGLSESPYPYPFIDFTIQPASIVFFNVVIIMAVFVIIGYIILLPDYIIKKVLKTS